jgi:hypothetical protein
MTPDSNSAEAGWQRVADDLATALRMTILRNQTVNDRDRDRAQEALGRYERAAATL